MISDYFNVIGVVVELYITGVSPMQALAVSSIVSSTEMGKRWLDSRENTILRAVILELDKDGGSMGLYSSS